MPHRILVVDDEEPIRSLLQAHLEGVGYRVVTAADGVEGIRVFQQKKPHLVIIDFLLPRKNGFAVAEAIRKSGERAGTPLLMMSGVFKNPKTAVEARDKYQVLEFLSKPLDLNQLTTLVAKGLVNIPEDDDVPDDPPPPPTPDPIEEAVREAAPVARGTLEPVAARVRESVPEQGTAAARPPPRGLSYFPSDKPSRPPPRPASVAAGGPVRDGVYQARPFPVLAESGDIEVLPVALLLSTIRYDQSTGMLDMTDTGGTHRRIYIVGGNPTFMQSNAEGENVGALLLRRGRITEPDFERCLRYMKDKGRTLQQSVLELRLVSESDLATAYKLLAGQLLPLALGMSSGSYRWRETDAFVGRVPEGKFEPVTTLFEGIKRHVHPPTILKFFKGREDVPLMRTLEFDRLMPFFRRSFSASNVASEVDGASTYRTITRAHNADAAQVVPQLFALVTSGMAVLPEVDSENAMAVAVNVAAAEAAGMLALDEVSGIELSFEDETGDAAQRDDKKAREIVARYYDEVRGQNFFEIFGVGPKASDEEIKARYFELAKTWHIDAFTGQNLGPEQAKLEAIFQRITEAYETITDRVRRDEYLTYLDRRARGLPTDMNEIRRTEQLFEQALAMIRRSDFVGAQPVLEEAIRKNPDPPYLAALGWVIYNLDPDSQVNVTESVKLLRKAIHEQENLGAAYQYLGQIAYRRNALPEAKKWWERCLEWEPNNPEATRGLRNMVQRGEIPSASTSASGQRSLLTKHPGRK